MPDYNEDQFAKFMQLIGKGENTPDPSVVDNRLGMLAYLHNNEAQKYAAITSDVAKAKDVVNDLKDKEKKVRAAIFTDEAEKGYKNLDGLNARIDSREELCEAKNDEQAARTILRGLESDEIKVRQRLASIDVLRDALKMIVRGNTSI